MAGIVMIAFGSMAVSCQAQRLDTVEITINGARFVVEVAREIEEQRIGLMFRRKLREDRGMLFVYETDRRLEFWMKDTYIPLSIAFLDRDGVIVELADMEPESLRSVPSGRSVRFALELNRGAYQRVGAGIGTLIELPPELLSSGGRSSR